MSLSSDRHFCVRNLDFYLDLLLIIIILTFLEVPELCHFDSDLIDLGMHGVSKYNQSDLNHYVSKYVIRS